MRKSNNFFNDFGFKVSVIAMISNLLGVWYGMGDSALPQVLFFVLTPLSIYLLKSSEHLKKN